jgi:hypothetical protein
MSKLGVIAEDDTDCDVMKVLARRVTKDEHFGIRRRKGDGCSKLVRKAERWMKELVEDDGCSHIVFLHDLDRHPQSNALNDLATLHKALSDIPTPKSAKQLICIPVEELEAWFWSDDAVIRYVGKGKGKAVEIPRSVARPKEALRTLSKNEGKKPRYSTNENVRLAAMLDLEVCSKKCAEFAALIDFLASLTQPKTALPAKR